MSLQEQYQQQQYSYHSLEQNRVSPGKSYWDAVQQVSGEQRGTLGNSTNIMNEIHLVEIMLEPVYVTEENGKSELMYDSRMMRENERYFVMWNGDPFALVKEGDKIIIYEGQIIS